MGVEKSLLYMYYICTLYLYRLIGIQNRVLKYFDLCGGGGGGWRRQHNDQFCGLYLSLNIFRLIKRWPVIKKWHVAHVGERKKYIMFWWGD
jgi:hypothetical protein